MAGSEIDEKEFRNLVNPNVAAEQCPFCKTEIKPEATVCAACRAYSRWERKTLDTRNFIWLVPLFLFGGLMALRGYWGVLVATIFGGIVWRLLNMKKRKVWYIHH